MRKTSKELTDCFFCDLKRYNQTNFKAIAKADLSKQDAAVHKAFSSVITRYFIFREKHPEIREDEFKLLYFVLSLDLVAQYFADYPDTTTDNLIAFQLHLKNYIKEKRLHKEGDDDEKGDSDVENSQVPDIGLESNNGLPVEQQQELLSDAV